MKAMLKILTVVSMLTLSACGTQMPQESVRLASTTNQGAVITPDQLSGRFRIATVQGASCFDFNDMSNQLNDQIALKVDSSGVEVRAVNRSFSATKYHVGKVSMPLFGGSLHETNGTFSDAGRAFTLIENENFNPSVPASKFEFYRSVTLTRVSQGIVVKNIYPNPILR